MGRKKIMITGIVAILCIVALIALYEGIGRLMSHKQSRVKAARVEAVEKGMRWIMANPANFGKDRLNDVVEEIMLFYHYYLTLDDLQKKVEYRKLIEEKIQMVADAGHVHVRSPVESTAFLVLADITDKLDIDAIDFSPIIKREIRANLLSYPPPPQTAFAVWNSLLLVKLGYQPLYPPEHLLSKGVIATLMKNPHLLDLDHPAANKDYVMNKFYEITHEIFALGALGKEDIALMGPEKMAYLREIIPKGMSRFIDEKEIDILAELVVCSDIIGFTDFEEYERAKDLIVASQLPDGSFGDIKRMIRMKKHPRRHGVLTSVWALL